MIKARDSIAEDDCASCFLTCCPCTGPCSACQLLRHEKVTGSEYSLCNPFGSAQLGPEPAGPSAPPGMHGPSASLPAGLSGALAHLVPEVRRQYLAMLETGGQGSSRLHKSLGVAAQKASAQMQMPAMGVTIRAAEHNGSDPVLRH